MNKRVYLAGPIKGLTYEQGVLWRKEAIKTLKQWGIEGVSPLRYKKFLEWAFPKDYILDDLKTQNLIEGEYEQAITGSKGVVSRDFFDVKNSDIILANLLNAKQYSIGTGSEIAWSHALRKPVIVVMEESNGEKRNPHEHSFTIEQADFRVSKLETGLLIAKAILCGDDSIDCLS